MTSSERAGMRDRYVRLFGEEPAGPGACAEIERQLEIKLPRDFREIAEFFSGGLLGGISHHAIAATGSATNVLEETQRLRQSIGLSGNLIVIAEPPESIILLQVDQERDTSTVFWCDVGALADLPETGRADRWEDYSAFFSHLLNLEEEERGLG